MILISLYFDNLTIIRYITVSMNIYTASMKDRIIVINNTYKCQTGEGNEVEIFPIVDTIESNNHTQKSNLKRLILIFN